jgi:hypothetical protein
LTGADGGDRGFLDRIRRIEIGLAGVEADDIAARFAQLARFLTGSDSRRGFDPVDAVGDERHEK